MMLFESRMGFERGRKVKKKKYKERLYGYRAVYGRECPREKREGIGKDHFIKLIIREQPTKNGLPCSRFVCRFAWCLCLRLLPQ